MATRTTPAIKAKPAAVAVGHSPAVTWLPLPGQPWPEQGGIYVGIAAAEGDTPAGHLVLLTDTPAKKLNWTDAVAWAKGLGNNAHLATRFECALLYANVRNLLNTNSWHWTGTHHAEASFAWFCLFTSGYQDRYRKSYEGSAVAVRRLDLHSFNPLN